MEAFAPGFADELRGLGYTPVSAVFQLQLMANASRWLDAAALGPDALMSDVVERFVAERRAAGYTNYVTARAMAPLLGYLRAIGVAPAPLRPRPATPAERLLERFGEYRRSSVAWRTGPSSTTSMRSGRSWTPSAVTAYWICSGWRPRTSRRSWLLAARTSRAARRR
ncbi:MAG: hypothetical protein ACR2H2_02330 [Solirubrobacteraceae bacterium]